MIVVHSVCCKMRQFIVFSQFCSTKYTSKFEEIIDYVLQNIKPVCTEKLVVLDRIIFNFYGNSIHAALKATSVA